MHSLRVRLLVWLCLALCTLWGGVATWMFADMQRELRNVLDERLIASARMVAGIVHQFSPGKESPQDWGSTLNVIARDGVACEVSLVRSEVQPLRPESALPQVLAKTGPSPVFPQTLPLGFSTMVKGGKSWRTYVLEEHGVRIATADRIDVREGLIRGFAYSSIFPFALALLASLVLLWWGVTRGLKPLDALRLELARRPPGDDSPVTQGVQTRELAPLVQSLNHLLYRVRAALERERRWSADAAHELRTPLTAVKTHVQVAQMALAMGQGPAASQGESWQMARQALSQADEGVEHLRHTLEQLLMLARLEQIQGQAAPLHAGEPANVAQALQKAWQLAEDAADLSQQRLQWLPGLRPDPVLLAVWRLDLPEPLLVSAWRNLLENALRHAPGAVHLGLCHVHHLPGQAQGPEAGFLCLTVLDQGPGLSAEECEAAMRRFWRKSPQGHGSGLGLPIVQRIAESCQGLLRLQPRHAWLQEQGMRDGVGEPGELQAATGLAVQLFLRLA